MINEYLKKKGAQGVGTLIIFIALILVAAVAAGVLIQTASSLQSKALDVGRQAREQITTDIDVIQVYVTDTNDSLIDAGTDNFTVIVRLSSGSNSIKLSDMILKFDTQEGSQTVINGGVSANASTSLYSVEFIINGTNHNDGYLIEGDLASFSFTSAFNISEAESVSIRTIAKNGAVKPVDMTTPPAMVESTTYLFP